MDNREAIQLLDELLLRGNFTDQYGDMGDSSPYEEAVEIAKQAIEKQMSSIQPKQKTGRWITRFDGTLHYCSECGWALMDTESGNPPYMGIDYHRSNKERWTCCPGWCEELMNYCPNCGAKMESEVTE